MKCEQITDQLSAWHDGELTETEQSAVEAHLATCAACRAIAEDVKLLHGQCVDEFSAARAASARVAERVIRQLPWQQSQPAARAPRTWRVVPLLAAAAAGFALAYACFAPPLVSSPAAKETPLADAPFAAVRLSTGPVEVAASGDDSGFAVPRSPLVAVGMKLRTGPYKGELQTASGATIRLDSGTQISVPNANELILETGRLWCRQPTQGSPLAISSSGTKIQLGRGTCDIHCDRDGGELLALDGEVQLQGENWQSQIAEGTKVRFANGKKIEESGIGNPLIATRWIHELLLQKQPDDEELQRRVEQLWASWGYSKVQYLYEEELRALGRSCVVPLASFLASNARVHQADHRRELAARIIGDLADFAALPRLIDLLKDEDAMVRFHMARALNRITGRDFGGSPEQWKQAPLSERQQWIQQWQDWLRQSQRFPQQADSKKPQI